MQGFCMPRAGLSSSVNAELQRHYRSAFEALLQRHGSRQDPMSVSGLSGAVMQ